MADYVQQVRQAFGPNRRNLAVAALVVAILVVSHVVVPHWSTRYAAYLIVFCIWMWWFVERVAGLLEYETE
ncbi:hypothetical protein BRD00_13765 [Halobacteriales archaeon QS_8_69_26]|nr:MAG: hypothetical protein BRD00_13765 [Halobacteriales archaeon QS_8_69_26]